MSGRASRCRLASALALALFVASCSTVDRRSQEISDQVFADAPRELRAQCGDAARSLRFAIPCPRRLPSGARPTVFVGGNCPGRDLWIGPGCGEARANAFASIEFDDYPIGVGHLVIVGVPDALSPEAVIYSPLPPQQWGSLRSAGSQTVSGVKGEQFKVPEGSSTAFAGHLVVVWIFRGRTYALGFHGTDRVAAQRNRTVLRDIQVIDP